MTPQDAALSADGGGVVGVEVEVVVATHAVDRPVERAVGSVLSCARAGVIVVVHNTDPGPVRERLRAFEGDPRLRVLELHDGVRSPAGPFNAGLDAARAPFVGKLDSDDELAPGAIDAWLECQLQTGADVVLGREADPASGRLAPTPPVRVPGRRRLDGVRDRLSYHSAARGIYRRERFPHLRFTPGLLSGEDIAFVTELWFAPSVRVMGDASAAYWVGTDAADRVTGAERDLKEDFAFLPALRECMARLGFTRVQAAAVVVKLIRVNLFSALVNRGEESWTADRRRELADVARELVRLEPRALTTLSLTDRRLLDAMCTPDTPSDRMYALLRKRQNRRSAGSLLTRSPLALLRRESPLRFTVASFAVMFAPGRRPTRVQTEDAVRSVPGNGPRPSEQVALSPIARARRLPGLAAAWAIRHRGRAPRWVNRAIDHVAEHPEGLVGRVVSRGLWHYDDADVPEPTRRPASRPAVYIAPTNYAGQGHEWARALHTSGVDAVNMAMEVPGGYAFPADTVVPLGVYERSEAWQRAERDVARGYTHVLVEAERAPFGRLDGRDVARQVEDLQRHGVSVAMIAHGTDVRRPSRHARDEPWSPFRGDTGYLGKMERDAVRNRALLERLGLPTFASTPDLLDDIPFARWCPVVVDPGRWSTDHVAGDGPLRVAHAPTNPALKGTDLIEPVLQRLHDENVIAYRRIVHVPHARMPEVFAQSDVVLDQFRLGSFGVAACEAMAAGCAAVAHVSEPVRRRVRDASGRDLPITEATPETLEDVLRGLAADRARLRRVQDTGRDYVRAVHDGQFSAHVLRTHWIDRTENRA